MVLKEGGFKEMIINDNRVYVIFFCIKKKIGINFNFKKGNYNIEKYFVINLILW